MFFTIPFLIYLENPLVSPILKELLFIPIILCIVPFIDFLTFFSYISFSSYSSPIASIPSTLVITI